MKKLRLLKLAFFAFLVTQVNVSKAQLINLVEPTFLVNSPAAVAGVKSFTMSHDGDATNTNNWGRAIDSFWYNLPVEIITGDTLALSIPTPGSLTGKFALVSRGTNMFSEKAYNVQQAGAVAIIIYNNVAGGPVGMAAGTNAASVSIPVIMISQSDGLALKAQILNGQAVNASLTNWGFGFTHDLCIVNNSMALLHNMAIPKYELDGTNASPYRSYLGALVANVGAATENNLKLKSTVSFRPTGGSSTVLLQDSVTVGSFSTIDSVIEMLSPNAQVLPAITQTGTIDVNYMLTAGAADDQPGNNAMSFSAQVTDSIYSKARINPNGEPTVTIGYRFSGQFVNTWGPLFWINKGNHYAVKTQFTVSNGVTGSTLDGSMVTTYVFKWTDANSDNLIDAGELDLKGAGVKNFTASDTNYMTFTTDIWSVPSQQPLTLDANSFYWIAAEVTNDLFLGCDGGINYFIRPYTAAKATPAYREYWAPQFQGSYNDLTASTGFLTHFPFQGNAATDIDSVSYVGSKGLVPAITLHTSMNAPNSVAGVNNISELKVYPNPAADMVNVDVKAKTQMDDVQVSVLDAVGKVVYRGAKSINGKSGHFSLDVSGYPSGNYFLVIRSGTSISSTTLSVIK